MPNNVTIEDIRVFLRDKLERNNLLERFEFTDKEIEGSMSMALDWFNLAPPFTTSGVIPNRALFIIGVSAFLLIGETAAQMRNQLNYSDGGIHVGVDDKASLYMQLGQSLKLEFQQAAETYKAQVNAESAFGGQISPYSGLPIL